MALTDIVNYSSEAGIFEPNRGNIGTLVDSITTRLNSFEMVLVVPAITDVKSGTQYGHQGTEKTGTYVGGGGGNIFVLCD